MVGLYMHMASTFTHVSLHHGFSHCIIRTTCLLLAILLEKMHNSILICMGIGHVQLHVCLIELHGSCKQISSVAGIEAED